MQRFYMVIMVRNGGVYGVFAEASGSDRERDAISGLINDEIELCAALFDTGAYPEVPGDGLWFTLGEYSVDGELWISPFVERDESGLARDLGRAPWERLSTAHLLALADGRVKPDIAAWLEGKPAA